MKKSAFVVLATLLGSTTAVFAASHADQAFMTNAIQGDLAEVQMGQLAQQKGGSEQVKSFGGMLVNDHQANEQKADQIAKQIGMTPPASPSAMQKSDYDRLSKLSGADFDRRFAAMMVADHKKNISAFRRESRKDNGAVAQFAKQTLPVLEKHLKAAEKIEHAHTAAR
jgi:putative membrane protein